MNEKGFDIAEQLESLKAMHVHEQFVNACPSQAHLDVIKELHAENDRLSITIDYSEQEGTRIRVLQEDTQILAILVPPIDLPTYFEYLQMHRVVLRRDLRSTLQRLFYIFRSAKLASLKVTLTSDYNRPQYDHSDFVLGFENSNQLEFCDTFELYDEPSSCFGRIVDILRVMKIGILIVHASQIGDFPEETIINSDQFCFDNGALYISGDVLLQFTGRTGFIHGSAMNEEHFNAFLRRWIYDPNCRVEKMEILTGNFDYEYNTRQIMFGIEAIHKGELRNPLYAGSIYDVFTIRRQRDGKIGWVGINKNSFCLDLEGIEDAYEYEYIEL